VSWPLAVCHQAKNAQAGIDFDDIWLKYSKDSRMEFVCFIC